MFIFFGREFLKRSSFHLFLYRNAWLTHITDIMLIFLHLIICCLNASVVARRLCLCCQILIPRLSTQADSKKASLPIQCLKSIFCLWFLHSIHCGCCEEKRVILSRVDHCIISKRKHPTHGPKPALVLLLLQSLCSRHTKTRIVVFVITLKIKT